MLRYAIAFLVVSLVAALVGLSDPAAGAVEATRGLFFVLLAAFVVLLALALSPPGGPVRTGRRLPRGATPPERRTD
jgi:uncharacterized membrane protein YtjA (UPF0391 family)